MKSPLAMIKVFNDRFPFVGPSLWMLSIQYYLIQLAVALDWTRPYSLRRNTISDLGNTACGLYDGKFVCSPLHGVMNTSFIVLGTFMILGSLLIYYEFRKSIASALGFGFMGLSGAGSILVGLFPENTISMLHIQGAAMSFILGNLALLLLGSALQLPRALRIYTLISGVIALIALILFVSHTYLGLGIGGMERLTAYPQSIWLIIFGIYTSPSRFLQAHKAPLNRGKKA